MEPIGTEFDAYWIVDAVGMEMALGELNATLIDFAKLGRLYMNEGDWEGTTYRLPIQQVGWQFMHELLKRSLSQQL